MGGYRRVGLAMACVLGTVLGFAAAPNLSAYAQGMGGSKLTIAPGSLSVGRNGTADAKVTATLSSGATWGTNLEATNLPKGLTVTFNPSSGDPTFTSTMTVHAASSVAPGSYTMTVQATGDDPSAAMSYKVT